MALNEIVSGIHDLTNEVSPLIPNVEGILVNHV